MAKNEVHLQVGSYDIVVRTRKGMRRISLRVYPTGSIVLTKPSRIPLALATAFALKNEAWITSKLEDYSKKPGPLLGHLSVRDYAKHKELAREIVHAKVAVFNADKRFPVGNIRIGNQKSRWGSCSAKKNLNFNYKIVFLPQQLADYLVVHELAHLLELNHSARFWNIVSEYIPNHIELRKKLKKY